MSFPRNSLRAFLSHAKSHLQSSIHKKQKVAFVLGNESADLDSLTSSLLYAYIRSQAPPRNCFTPFYIPILNILEADIALRPEFTALFKHANITASHLLTLSDLPTSSEIASKLPPVETSWILVDHNALQGSLGEIYTERVGGAIDHHADERTVSSTAEPRIIETAGSCTSLVVNHLAPTWNYISGLAVSAGAGHGQHDSPILDDGSYITTWDAQVAFMCLASILIDTTNLTSKAKTTDHDRKAVSYLEARIKVSPKLGRAYDRGKYFEEIKAAKESIGELPLPDILRKDYKQWSEGNGCVLGMSSVVKPLSFLIEKASSGTCPSTSTLASETAAFSQARNLSLYAIMTTSTSEEGQFQRELLLEGGAKMRDAIERFEREEGGILGLEEIDLEDEGKATVERQPWRKVWRQKELGMSRKQVAPMLRRVMGDG